MAKSNRSQIKDNSSVGSLGRNRLSRRRFIIAAAAVLAAGGIGARIGYVNATAVPKPEVIHHRMGEWIDLNGAFIQTAAIDQTEGYYLRISAAEHLSYNEYVRRYVDGGLKTVEGLDDYKPIVCITMDIRNEYSEGGIGVSWMDLINHNRTYYYVLDTNLYPYSEPNLDPNIVAFIGVSIQPGTEYTTHLPYDNWYGETVEFNGETIHKHFLSDITDTSMQLIVSYLPVQHVVDLTVT